VRKYQANTFCKVARNICGATDWNLPASHNPGIKNFDGNISLFFFLICGPLINGLKRKKKKKKGKAKKKNKFFLI